jgi:membrane-bound lytic murein transglycosylase A
VLFTGYYEPIYEGNLTLDETFRYPLYRPPDDLVRIDLSLFSEKFKGENIIARIEGKKVLPYYSRYQIEAERVLEGRELLVHYQASNGRPYRSIGRYMIEREFLTREEMSMQAIRRYLTENPAVLEEVLNYNPSYIFFRQVENGPLGSLGVLLTPGRSVALDSKIFQRGLGLSHARNPLLMIRERLLGGPNSLVLS